MGEYEEILKDIEKKLGMIPDYVKFIPKNILEHDWAISKKTYEEETKIPGKYKQLIGLAGAIGMKSHYWAQSYETAAKHEGATDEEIAEVYNMISYDSRWDMILQAKNYEMETVKKEFKKEYELKYGKK